MRRFVFIAWMLGCVLLAFAARCSNLRDVFIEGRIYFTDADCYSRMTRAQRAIEQGAPVIRHHDFENWPKGITAHTTAPLDWLIVAGKVALDGLLAITDRSGTSILRGQTLDLAGALVSPVLGALTCAWLALWARRTGKPWWAWAPVPAFFAASPVMVHGTILGRPDHQSLLLLLVAIALGRGGLVENERVEGSGAPAAIPAQRRVLVEFVAWALALWVSLYEPLVLLVVLALPVFAFDRAAVFSREARAGWIAFAAIIVVAFAIDGWRITTPDAAVREYFANWSRTIGELKPLRAELLWPWLGWGCVAAPVLLVVAGRRDPRAWLWLALLTATFALTCWQIRWGYFLALVFAMSLPWQFAVLRRSWAVALLLLTSAWPVAMEWESRLFPDDQKLREQYVRQTELVSLRKLAAMMAGPEQRAFIAPWWLSPSLAYWSGQPGVAGSSHESLSGIVDTARFYLAEQPEAAVEILRRRRVSWVVSEDLSRVLQSSCGILGTAPAGMTLAERLTADRFALRESAFGPAADAKTPALRFSFLTERGRTEYFGLFLVEDSTHSKP